MSQRDATYSQADPQPTEQGAADRIYWIAEEWTYYAKALRKTALAPAMLECVKIIDATLAERNAAIEAGIMQGRKTGT